MELDVPAILVVDALPGAGLDIVADDLHVADLGLADEVGEEGADDGLHAAAQDDDGDIVGAAPGVELLEGRVELDALEQGAHAGVEGRPDAVHHLLEGLPEGARPLERVPVAPPPQLDPEPQVVRQEVVAVLQRDGPVEVGEEDGLGLGPKGR